MRSNISAARMAHVYIQQEFKGWSYGKGVSRIISRRRIRQANNITLPRDASLALALTQLRQSTDHDIDLSYRVSKKYRVSQDDQVVLYGMTSTQHAIISQS